jgi:hypothetical protein
MLYLFARDVLNMFMLGINFYLIMCVCFAL